MTNLAPQPIFQGLGPNGAALAGGLLYTYAAGTTTPQTTYTDSTGGTPNTNPVVLNSFGQAAVWLDPTLAYKFILKDTLGNQLWSTDNIPGALAGTGSIIPDVNNSYDLGSASFQWRSGYFGTQVYVNAVPVLNGGNIGYIARTAAEIAAGVTPTAYQYPEGDGRRYGMVCDGTTDDAAALGRLFLVMGKGVNGFLPGGYTSLIKTGQTIVAPSYERIALNADGFTLKTQAVANPIKVTGGFMGGCDIIGITVDNTTDGLQVIGIDLFGAQNCAVIGAWWRIPDATLPQVGATFIRIEPSDPTNDNTGAFWNRVIRCGTRQDTGNVTYYAPGAVQIFGASNACTVEDCNFASVNYAVELANQTSVGATGTLPNAVTIRGTAFESGTSAVWVNGNSVAASHIEGLRVYGCRFESLSGAAYLIDHVLADSAVPMQIFGNFYVSSVTSYITQNGSSITINANDPSITPAWGVGSTNTEQYTNGFWFFKSASAADDAFKIGSEGANSGIGLYTLTGTRLASLRNRTGGGAYLDSPSGWDARTLQGISNTSTQANNLRGSVSLTTATTAVITFATAEADANYFPFVTFIGTAGVSQPYVVASSKLTTGFTVDWTGNFTGTLVWMILR